MKRRTFIRQSAGAAILTSVVPATAMWETVRNPLDKSPHICIFSKHLHWLGYGEMARLAADMGFTGIDLTVRPGGHVLPEKVKKDLPEAVKRIRGEGLEVPMMTTAIKDAADPLTRDILETAGKLGIGLYRTGWFKYSQGVPVAETIDLARQKMIQLHTLNEANQIAASYQNHAGLSVGSSGWDLLKIIEGLDPRWTGVQFDIRHAMVEGPKTWPVFLEILAPYINSLDIKDFTWEVKEEAEVVNVPLGQGMVPFKTYFEKLNKLGVRADYSIHYEYPMGGAEHGDAKLGISKEKFVELVQTDLRYLKNLVH